MDTMWLYVFNVFRVLFFSKNKRVERFFRVFQSDKRAERPTKVHYLRNHGHIDR